MRGRITEEWHSASPLGLGGGGGLGHSELFNLTGGGVGGCYISRFYHTATIPHISNISSTIPQVSPPFFAIFRKAGGNPQIPCFQLRFFNLQL
jgi:hypothetical protein